MPLLSLLHNVNTVAIFSDKVSSIAAICWYSMANKSHNELLVLIHEDLK